MGTNVLQITLCINLAYIEKQNNVRHLDGFGLGIWTVPKEIMSL